MNRNDMRMGSGMKTTVLFIHGEWLSAAAWDNFSSRYRACGYTCIAPPWPLSEGPPERLRNAPHTDFPRLGIRQIIEHYAALIQRMPQPPLLIGHSLGGLLVQLLLDRGLGCAGIAIAAIPPRGAIPRLSVLYRAIPMRMAWGSWKRVMYFPLRAFTQQFTQAMAVQDISRLHAKHIVPAPGRIFFEAAFGIGTYVDFANDRRAPLLLIAAEKDHSIRPCVVTSNYRHYNRSAASTSLKCFAGYSHWLIVEPGWEHIADYTIEWAQTQLGRF